MYTVSKKDLNKAELETVRMSKSPTMVATGNREVPAKEEATVFVREVDLFSKVMLGENTLAVFRTNRCPWSTDKLFKIIFTLLSGRELMRMIGVGISFVSQTKQRTHMLIGLWTMVILDLVRSGWRLISTIKCINHVIFYCLSMGPTGCGCLDTVITGRTTTESHSLDSGCEDVQVTVWLSQLRK